MENDFCWYGPSVSKLLNSSGKTQQRPLASFFHNIRSLNTTLNRCEFAAGVIWRCCVPGFRDTQRHTSDLILHCEPGIPALRRWLLLFFLVSLLACLLCI